MNKTKEYTRRAVDNYMKRKMEAGFIRYVRWVKPKWKEKLDEVYKELKNKQ